MLEFIKDIDGPLFLLYYIILVAACLGLGWLLISVDGSTAYRLPDPKRHKALAVAALGGKRPNKEQRAMMSSIFSLWQRGGSSVRERGWQR
jgi:hypothetical protein